MAYAKDYTGAALYHTHGFYGQDVVIAIMDTGVAPHKDLTLLEGWGVDGCNPHEDINGHGTHVAGIAAGKQYGVAPKAKILPVRISSAPSGNSNAIIMGEALAWIVDWKKKNPKTRLVVNISYSGTEDPRVQEGIDNLVAMDVPVCVATGNTSGELAEIAGYETPIVVSNLEEAGKHFHRTSSCRGKQTDCCVVGTNVRSCRNASSGYCYMTGTSMASPAVAGMMALILSRFPNISEPDAYELLMECGEDVLVSCRDGKHFIPHVSFNHTTWEKDIEQEEKKEEEKEEEEVRENNIVTGIKKGFKLQVREKPNSAKTTKIVGYVRTGDKVIALRTEGQWREIVFATSKNTAVLGWINEKYLKDS